MKNNNYIITDSINSKLQLIDKLQTKLASHRPIPTATLNSLKDDLRLNWTYNSNAIEGNTLTLKETKVALEGITIGGKTIVEHLEATNHSYAISYVEQISTENSPLTENIIKNIHSLVLKSIDTSNAGIYRNQNVIISGATHVPPNHLLIQEQIKNLINMYNNDWINLHPICKASLLHGEFVKIHPFIDGNGRTARLLMNFSLMKDKFIPIIITNDQRYKYYEALDKAHTTNEYDDFITLISERSDAILTRWLSILE